MLIVRCDTKGCDAEEVLSPWYWPAASDAEIRNECGWTVTQEPVPDLKLASGEPVTKRAHYCPDCSPAAVV